MKKYASGSLGIIGIAALFGLVALLVSYFILHFGGMAAFVVGLIVAIITAIILWMGLDEHAAGAPDMRTADSSPAASPKASAPKPSVTPASAPKTAPVVKETVVEKAVEPASAPKAEETAVKEPMTETKSAPVAEVNPDPVAKAEPAPTPAPVVKAEPKAEPKPVAKAAEPAKAVEPEADEKTSTTAAAPKRAPVAADGKPEMLSAPRDGAADDLKQIKGVGPKMEGLLNSMGVWHFDQVAGWRKKEVEWVDENLEGFKGRVTRDEWVNQAKLLAKGEATEFSKKVKKGGVY